MEGEVRIIVGKLLGILGNKASEPTGYDPMWDVTDLPKYLTQEALNKTSVPHHGTNMHLLDGIPAQ